MKAGAVLAAAAAAILMGAGAASAADITRTYAFTAEHFVPYFGPPAPEDPLLATFTITFDPAVDTGPTSAGLKLVSANFPTLTPEFAYSASTDSMSIGTKPTAGAGFLTNQNGDYGLSIFNAATKAEFGTAQYIALDGTGEYFSQTGTVVVSSAPEPATWALWISGAALAGAALRRRRTTDTGALVPVA